MTTVDALLIYSHIPYFFLVLFTLLIFSIRKGKMSERKASFTIVVAARNEAGRVEMCLNSLSALNYPPELYEVLLVDDASTDETRKILTAWAKKYLHWHMLAIDEKSKVLKGKKAALSLAIEQAKGEVIAVTDADCTVPTNWLRQLATHFDEKTVMVLGHAQLEQRTGWLNTLLQFDNLFSAIMVALPTKLGFANSSVGRNMAYRKSAFNQVGGYAQLSGFTSGDDVHLTELFRKNRLGKIVFMEKAQVVSKPPETNSEIWQQQLRKNSKVLKKSALSILFSLILFAYFFFTSFFFLFSTNLQLWLYIIALKFGLEFVALLRVSSIFNIQNQWFYFPLMQLVYPFYVTVLIIMGSVKPYHWKS